jgi:hypothetical protein
MASPVTSVPRVHIQTNNHPSRDEPASPPKPRVVIADTVHISAAAQVLQERTEATNQTVEAAAGGDLQSKAQLAKPAVAGVTTR